MGTEKPNPNAVLELVSENRNQGLLVPRLSAIEANALVGQLSAKDNGLLVFIEDQGAFYYWWNDNWLVLEPLRESTGTGTEPAFYLAGKGIQIENEVIQNTGDLDDTNELQDLTSVLAKGADAGKSRISNVADPIDPQDVATRNFVTDQLGALSTPTLQYDDATSSLSIIGGNTISLEGSLTNTDAQTLSLSGTSLSISNGNNIDLSIIDNDQQALTLSGSSLSISGGNAVDLSSINPDPQDLTLSGNTLSLTGDATSVNLSANAPATGQVLKWNAGSSQWEAQADSNTEYTAGTGININGSNQLINTAPDQPISLAGAGGVSVSGTYPNFTISSTDNVDDADADSANEIQDLSLSGNTLSITNNASATGINLAPYLDNTDSQNLSSSKAAANVSVGISGGNTTTFSVADNDDSPSNEKIDAVNLISGDVLRIQEAGSNHDVDLSGFQKAALPTSQVLVGNTSGVASPVSISGDITLNSDGTMTITLDAVTTSKIIDNAITTAKLANDAVTKEKIHSGVAGNGIGQNVDGSLEINIAGGGLQRVSDQLQLTNQGDGQLLIGDGSQVNAHTMSGDVSLTNTGATTITSLQGNPVSAAAPGIDNVLTWNGSTWVPEDVSSFSLFGDQQWYAGTAVPSTSSPSGADNGDYYYDTDDNMVYQKSGGSWGALGGFSSVAPASINTGGIADSYRAPVLYMGDAKPVDDDDIGAIGDFYYSRDDEKLYYRYLDTSTGKIKWKIM
ncbi:MAG: hypothetical protein RIG62_16260 [Cyclobacteriaceae bacterium]